MPRWVGSHAWTSFIWYIIIIIVVKKKKKRHVYRYTYTYTYYSGGDRRPVSETHVSHDEKCHWAGDMNSTLVQKVKDRPETIKWNKKKTKGKKKKNRRRPWQEIEIRLSPACEQASQGVCVEVPISHLQHHTAPIILEKVLSEPESPNDVLLSFFCTQFCRRFNRCVHTVSFHSVK